MQDIKGYETFTKVEPVNKGWSEDKKYYIETDDGSRLLLRMSDISKLEQKRSEFEWMRQAAALGVPMSMPLDFGVCGGGANVYILLTWIDGEDAEAHLPLLSESEQYALGIKAGEILKMLHSCPAPEGAEPWAARFNKKVDNKLQKYRACPLRFEGDDEVIGYIEKNRHLLENRPQCRHHGDYHVGNMIIDENKHLSIIDFNRPDAGDPWEEFNRIVWSAAASPHFATGQIDGYFGSKPPRAFFELLAFYIACNTLSSIYWAIPFGEAEVQVMMNQARDVLSWFDRMQNPVPTWYVEGYYTQTIDGVRYKLKSPFDFGFIGKYGTVFKVYDDQDSGNICFGVQNEDGRYFIKFAGAPTARGCVSASEAIANLKRTAPIYRALAHRNLIKLVRAEEIGGGFAMVFEWTDAVCMHPMYPLARRQFMQMPTQTRLRVYAEILSFHAHAAAQGYVAIDFYEGSIMYDFDNEKTVLCDIDFYEKAPYVNRMGRLWGSKRFMSPEEFTLGAAIDEITNVYTMGAAAFALFGDAHKKDRDDWTLTDALYRVAKKAVSEDRALRQPSIARLIEAWNEGMDE